MSLQDFLREFNPSQVAAWHSSIPIVQHGARSAIDAHEMGQQFHAVFEYELPREGGRRPDVVLLQNGIVLVLEFKERASIHPADIDQVAAYARDLKNYHEHSHNLEVVPVLIPTSYRGQQRVIDDVAVLPPAALPRFLVEQASRNLGDTVAPERWVNAQYLPLPNLVQAARLLYEKQPLPRIKRAESARIPEVVDSLQRICHIAASEKSKHIIFLTGVPGAGKTLVGLQLAHSKSLDYVSTSGARPNGGAPAVFLSGNGPLVQVLQDALGSRAFVDGMKRFIEYYGFKRPDLIPSEHVLIFDEAQRAWDADQMGRKYGDKYQNAGPILSEAQMLVTIANRLPDWGVVLALVGEGQEIHRGEEAGLLPWARAIGSASGQSHWHVHCPPHLADLFVGAGASCRTNELLNLSTSLRSRLASDLHRWVGGLLQADSSALASLQPLAAGLWQAGYRLYVTRDIEVAKEYVRMRYRGMADYRYGLLASRYAKNLRCLGIDNTYHFQRAEQLDVAKWFNAPTADSASCCALRRPASEFECQGLELDFPIVCWGDDLLWSGQRWLRNPRIRRGLSDPDRVTLNAYRVLLTRGRDGMCMFIPPDSSLDAVEDTLRIAGARPLVADGDPSAPPPC